MSTSLPLQEGVSQVPRDGTGTHLSKKNGKYVPNSNKPSVNVDILNQVTDNGINTRQLIETGDINNIQADTGSKQQTKNIKEANHAGSTTLPVSKPRPDNTSSDPAYNANVSSTTKMFGQQLWNIKVNIYNHSQPVYELNPTSISSLVIDDDVLSWPLRGYIVIDNRIEGFEKGTNDDLFYHIRADGRDEIFIDLFPAQKENDLPDDIWRIKLHACIYDVEDLPSDDVTTKKKKLYFWDKKFQFLQEQTIQWSTATGPRLYNFKSSPPPKPISHATDIQRSMYTGEAIASLLIAAGYENYIDLEQWDFGAGRINYTAKSNWTIWDNIEYIVSQHVSDGSFDQSLCGLGYDRAKEKFTLIPRGDIYRDSTELGNNQIPKPGKLQIEHLFFTDRSDENVATVSPWKAPFSSDSSFERDIKSVAYSTIVSFQYSQMSGLDNSKAILTKPVYSHQHKNKQFQVDVQENEITGIRDYFKTQYVDHMLGNGVPIFPINKTKTETLSIDPVFSPVSTLDSVEDRRIRSEKGRGSVLFAGVFLNQCLAVSLPGSSHRLAGTFVGVDRSKESSDTNYDYQLCGQYFVVKVSHVFSGDNYVNNLTLVKVHAYDELKKNEEVY